MIKHEYHLLVLSKYDNQEGYLDIILKGMAERFGSIIQIDFDNELNPYLLIKEDDFKLVSGELEKKALKIEAFESGSFNLLKLLVDKCEIHKAIQQQDGEQLKYTINLN